MATFADAAQLESRPSSPSSFVYRNDYILTFSVWAQRSISASSSAPERRRSPCRSRVLMPSGNAVCGVRGGGVPAAAGWAARLMVPWSRSPWRDWATRHVVTRRVRHPQRVRSRVPSYERNDIDGANVRVCQGRWGWACAMSQAQTQAQAQSQSVAVEVR